MTIDVPGVKIEVKSVNVTVKIIKQLRMMTYGEFGLVIKEKRPILGWFDGHAAGIADGCWLLCKFGDQDYRIFNAHFDNRDKFPQIIL